MPKNRCKARQYGDQMICDPCGVTWDTNDPEPPRCGKVDNRLKVVKLTKEFVNHKKPPALLPSELPPDLAVEMSKAYRIHALLGGVTNGAKGMQAAYRLFLDRMEL